MSSRLSQNQDQQQERAMFADPCDSRSTASTSRMRPGNGMISQQNFPGVQGGCRSEPLRPRTSYPAPSTIHPDDSASLQGSQIGSDSGSRRNANQFNDNPNYAPRNHQLPQVTPQTSSSYGSVSRGSQNQYAPPSFRSAPQGNRSGTSQSQLRTPSSGTQQAPPFFDGSYGQGAPSQRSAPAAADYQPLPSLYEYVPGNDPDGQLLKYLFGPDALSNVGNTATPSTARSANRAPSDMAQSSTRGSTARSEAAMSTRAISQNRALAPSASLPFNSNGSQLSPGINIGVLPGTQMHFHYNQVDNRQLSINNNAPQNVVTHNNQKYTTDNSNHHNTHAPQANSYNIHAANVGNTHTNVSQKAKAARQATPSSSIRAPSETIRIRDRLSKRVSRKEVPNDRPC